MKSNSKLVFCISLFLAYGSLTLLVFSPRMPPTGDEPHYLLTAHSIAVDGDIYLLNNYKNRDYRIFYPGIIAKRTTRGADPSVELPAFSPGLSFFLSPFYKIAIVFFPGYLVPFLRLVICCITVVAIYQLMNLIETFGSPPSFLPLAGAALASPLITYCCQFYPEILAFLFLILVLMQFQKINENPKKAFIWLSLLSPALLWLHPKYLVLSLLVFAISCFLFARLVSTDPTKKFRVLQWLHILISLSGIFGFFLFLHSYYGSWSPNRIYGGVQRDTSLIELIQTLGWERVRIMFRMIFGYWMDERFGLIPYAPIYAAFFSALLYSLRKYRYRMLPAAILFGAHFLLISWAAQMGGYSPPSRHMVALLSTILLPILLVFPHWSSRQKILFVILEVLGWLVSVAMVTHYRLIFTEATWRKPDGGSVFWQWAGLDRWIPNLTATDPDVGLIIVWICITLLISAALYPRNSRV
jgi:hypothetical protein